MASILRVLDWLSLATTLNESKRVLPTGAVTLPPRQMLEEFCESNAGNIGKAFSPYSLHSILIETLQGFLKKVPMIQSGMLIYQKAVQYLGSWILYVLVRLISNGRTTDINVSNYNRSCYWHIQPFGLSIKEIELDLPRGKPSQYSLGNALSPTKICSLSQGQILTSSEVKIS